MKAYPFHLFKLAIAAIIAYPAFVFAAPPSTSPYYTDTTNSYVQDQVTEDMFALNGFLCLMSAMAPSQMVNSGDYIALMDVNSCFMGGSGKQSSNKGVEYFPVQLNSSRASNSSPMKVKMWFDFEGANVPLYATATQAPSSTLPYGIFRMDGCVKLSADASCDGKIGYIEATKGGLSFYFSFENNSNVNELALQMSASSTLNSGTGVLVKTEKSTGPVTTSATVFAYSPDYFFRNDGTTPKCFNRSINYAEESAWRYGLYDAVTGERFNRKSGFPIEYTDTGTGVTYNGYIGYYGISMPVDVPTGKTVSQITYDTNPPTKTPYTLLKTGGKLTKYTTASTTLSVLNKLPIWYYVQSVTPIPVAGGSILTMTPNSYYEIYWDDTAKKFFVSGQQNPTTNVMETLATPHGSVLNTDMVAADVNGWGLSGWSQLLGGNFTIKAVDLALLDTMLSTTPVITQTQDVVYPKDFDAINAVGGLQCIGDCPKSADFAGNTNTYVGSGWGPFAALVNQTYSLDPVTGNLLDGPIVSGSPTGSPVVNTTTSVVTSGKLVTATVMASIQTAKTAAACISPCSSQSDVDLLTNPVYYVWQTSSDSWSQMAFLFDGTKTVTFYPPLPVSFLVPNTTEYGNLAGSTVSLQYDEFGNLWGIPNECIDIITNTDCVFVGITATLSANQHWAPRFSIPFSTTDGVVTAGISQGTITQGMQFLVKALDKEIRLAPVPENICTVLGLTKPISIAKLPSSADWSDPRPMVGTKPVLDPVPAPQVIHGVKQY